MRTLFQLLTALYLLWHGTTHASQELWVFAASSLSPALEALAPAFEKANPGVRVVMQFAASGTLLAQMRQGAPADVLATADGESMDRAGQLGLIASQSRMPFAGNRLVLVAPRGTGSPSAAPPSLSTALARLRSPRTQRIALGNPATVPLGRYSQQALKAAGVWDDIQPRVVLAESARQALTYVARAEVDAAILYASDAALESKRLEVLSELPLAEPIRYEIARSATSKQTALADAFIAFMRSPQARAELSARGLTLP
jgi:molybdate transport system substrate-binding protein